MIADTALFLVVLGIISSFKIGVKADKFLSVFSFLVFTAFAFFFFQQQSLFKNTDFSFVWSSLPSGDIYVNIISNQENFLLLFPFFLLTLSEVCKNAVFRYEERRCVYNGLLFFNLLALLMMISSNNFVQLLSGVFVVDILAFLIVKDIDNSKSYVVLNLLADMLLFTVLAVANSQISSLSLQEIERYRHLGKHLDFVSLGTLIAIFIKLGFFPFHGGMLQLRHIRFHRLQGILFLASPATAVILLLKFNVLWHFSAYFSIMIFVCCLVSGIWGFFRFLLADEIKAKMVYLQMLFWSLFVEILHSNEFIWQEQQSGILLSAYLLMNLFYYFYHCANRLTLVSALREYPYKNKLPAVAAGVGIIAVSAVMSFMLLPPEMLKNLPQNLKMRPDEYFVAVFSLLLFLSVSILLHQLCNPFRKQAVSKKIFRKINTMFLFLSVVIFLVVMHLANINRQDFIIYAGVFLFLSFLPVPTFILQSGRRKKLQKFDIPDNFYQVFFIDPLRACGRVLWLLVDWLFVEKFIVGTLQAFLLTAVRLFRNIHYNWRLGSSFLMLLLIVLLWLAYSTEKSLNA